MNRRRAAVCAFLSAQALAIAACSISPEWERIASRAGMEIDWVETGAYRHLVISNARPGHHLSIYIEGDGTPWIRERRIAIDPTPADPLLLRLMVDHGAAALYLGRPCYFGTATSRSCHPEAWTTARYADAVVQSMCEAANRLSAERRAQSVGLIGYSGGGRVAIAMRRCTRGLRSITTIAANLDVDAWTTYHEYAPLKLPRQPAAASGDVGNVTETHWQCSTDENVPPAITDSYFARHPDARRIIVDDCSHGRGWGRYRRRIQASADRSSEPVAGQ